MIFNELSFFLLFLLPAVALFHALGTPSRPWVLAVFGGLFFMYYGQLHFGGFWGALCVLIFVWELLTSRLYRPGSAWCVFGIVQAIAILIVFKYLPFMTGAWNDLAQLAPVPTAPTIGRLVLPLGISFFTFEFIHFAADSYRGRIDRPRVGRYAAFIFFFPTMVAGPIKRFQDFDGQLAAARCDPDLIVRGVTRILAGLAKKHVLADTFGLWSDQLNTAALFDATGLQIGGWILAYGMKIYFDFSGYSDIAIGSAYLFGIIVPENFNWPYASASITEFWRRWHISLSRWIFDYVYVPLGGSRHGEPRAMVNVILAFAISGLWHGANYNFLAWGLWHGGLVAGHRAWRRLAAARGLTVPRPLAIALTFALVNIGWALFCMDLGRVADAFTRALA